MDKVILNCLSRHNAILSFKRGNKKIELGELEFPRKALDAIIECLSGPNKTAEFIVENMHNAVYIDEEIDYGKDKEGEQTGSI